MPRNAGKNFWYQAYKLKQLGIKSFYIAMFDEYDEGTAIAKKAIEKGITEAVFDRGGYIYHGRVQELADGAREGGLEF